MKYLKIEGKMKKLREIFWKYFVEKKWGQLGGLNEPKLDDTFGTKLFGVMNFIGFVMIIALTGSFLTFFLIMTRIISGNILWPGLIAVLFMTAGAWGLIGVAYYARLKLYSYAVLNFVGLIVLLFFAYFFFIGGLK